MKFRASSRDFDRYKLVKHVRLIFASDFLLKVPNRYTVPLRQGIDLQDLITGDGTMFETDLDNYGEKINCVLPPTYSYRLLAR